MSSIDPVWHIGSELRALKAEAAGLLDQANEQAWRTVPPPLLELIRLRIAELIGNQTGLQRRSSTARDQGLTEAKIAQLGRYDSSELYTDLERRCLAFAEQIVIDVTRIPQAERDALRQYFTAEQMHEWVIALYITECTQRLEMMGPALLGGLAGEGNGAAAADRAGKVSGDIGAVLEAYQAAVVRGSALDLVTTELVRLRCARVHNCRICRTLRLAPAIEAGVDDSMTAKIDFYEKSDLDERSKTALRITDAFITRPDSLKQSAIAQARSLFTPEALAEMCFDITKWSVQKIYVSQDTDSADFLPKNEQGVSFLSFAEDGNVGGFAASLG